MGQYMAQRHIQQRTAHHAKNRFAKQEYHKAGPLGRFCRQQRHRFIAGSNKDGQQRAGCDDPAGVQVGRHCTEPALGHTAQNCAGHKTPAAAACQSLLNTGPVVAFQPFDQQVRQIQKRQHFYAVGQSIPQRIYK